MLTSSLQQEALFTPSLRYMICLSISPTYAHTCNTAQTHHHSYSLLPPPLVAVTILMRTKVAAAPAQRQETWRRRIEPPNLFSSRAIVSEKLGKPSYLCCDNVKVCWKTQLHNYTLLLPSNRNVCICVYQMARCEDSAGT